MNKKLTKSKSLSVQKLEVKHFSKFAPKQISLPKKHKAMIGFDKEKRPAWFLFDALAFWELMCRIDEGLFEVLPDKLYDSNPAGEIIDGIEANWPFSKKYKEEIKREYKEALRDIKSGKVFSL